MIFLIKILLFTIIINLNSYVTANENRIIFKINNKIFTNIDTERRYKYIGIISNLESNNISDEDKRIILEDYISSLIFYEYKIVNNLNFEDLNNQIDKFYIENVLNKLNLSNFNNEEIINIKENIKIDLIRKKIIQDIINTKKNILLKESDSLDLIYNYILSYIIISKANIDINIIKNIKNKKNFLEFKEYIDTNNLQFFYKKTDINDITMISERLRNQLNNNIKIDKFESNNYYNIYLIDKNLESYEGVYVKLFNLKTSNILDENQLNCNYLNNLKDKTIFKEYEYSKLNQEIKDNLKSVNDFIMFENQDLFNYIFLCELKYDEKLLNNINFNKKVNALAENIQIKFINKYKKEFKFEKF